MDNKLTIKDIAEIAQVSKGTVSKALNDQPGVGKATKERILKLVNSWIFTLIQLLRLWLQIKPRTLV